MHFSVKELNKYFYKTFKLSLITLGIGIPIVAISWFFNQNQNLYEYDISTLPTMKQILFNNIKFVGLYLVPIIGPLYYLLNFIVIYVFIGTSIAHSGMIFTLVRLIHFPIELFALSIPVILSYHYTLNCNKKERKTEWMIFVKLLMISVILLLFSAVIESFLK